MKKTQFIELLYLVKHSIVPFLSIVLFVTMGITLYAGMTWTGVSIEDRVDAALDQGNASDFVVMSQLGLAEDDINKLSQVAGVEDVEPAYLSYEVIQGASGESDLYCTVQSITERINILDLVEGTMPTKSDEVVLLSNCVNTCGYRVGDTITFEADGDDPSVNGGMKYLKGKTYTITGMVGSSEYLGSSIASLGINTEGRQISCVFYANKDAFSSNAFGGAYPLAYVTGTGLRELKTFSAEYSTTSSNTFAAIKQAGVDLAQSRYDTIKGDADQQISNGKSQLADAKNQINDAETQISDAEQTLADKESQLADAKVELADSIDQVESAQEEATEQFAQAESELDEYKSQLSQLQQTYADTESQITYYDNMSASLRELSASILARFEALKNEAQPRMYDADFTTWVTGKCAEVNAATAQEVAAFKEAYPTRPTELESLLDGLELTVGSLDTAKKAAENAAGLSVAADKIQSEVVQPGQSTLSQMQSAIDQLEAGIASGQDQLIESKLAYHEQMDQAESQIASGQSEIASGQSQLDDGKAQLADGKTQLDDKKSQYADGERQLADAEVKEQQIHPSSWVVTDREDTHVAKFALTTIETLYSLRLTMALLFIIVGLLVCYSVMSRLVHENSIQLGTKKALGFTLFEIAKLFLGYALFACVLGIVLGALAGAPVVQLILIPSMCQYVFDPPGVVYRFIDVVPVGAVQIVLVCLSAWLACRSILKKNAVDLLAGHRPSAAKQRFYEKWACWKRAGMLTQTMVNNCFNDRRRAFGTLVGVAGCTSLIVCAMTLQGGIYESNQMQENVIERYDQVVYVSDADKTAASSAVTAGASSTATEDAPSTATAASSTATADSSSTATKGAPSTATEDAPSVDEVIASTGYSSLRAQYDVKTIDLPDFSQTYVTLIVPDDMSNLSDVMTLQITKGDETLSADGVYISYALSEHYGYNVGDELTFGNADGTFCKVPVAGVFEYYGGTHILIMNGDVYEDCFGVKPAYSARLVASGSETDAFSHLVSTAADFDGITDSRAVAHVVSSTTNTLALTVVAIYIGISALVALFVLLNLNIMYIAEKKRELIVMMINGYEVKDAKRYVSRDTIIMDALGMVVGCLLGSATGILATESLENDRISFLSSVSPYAWLIGIAVCALFSFIVMRIALRRVDKFKLTSINE